MERVRADYTARADDYIALLGSMDATASEDRALVSAWCRRVDGLVIDVGCGPGQWTNFLHGDGADVIGVDPVGAFITSARSTYPYADFRLGRAEDLDVPDASVGGVLAWYSLIHTEPELLGLALTEFARVIRPGGSLLLGFFVGAEREPFEHAVTTAYLWPVSLLAHEVQRAGFVVTSTDERTDPGARPHGAIIAQRVAQAAPVSTPSAPGGAEGLG